MWDCHWQPPEDYGTRYTIGVLSSSEKYIAWADRWCERVPELGWMLYDTTGRSIGPSYRGKPVWQIPPSALSRHGEFRGFNFTRGVAAALAAVDAFAPQVLDLWGFGDLFAGAVTDHRYPEAYMAFKRATRPERLIFEPPAVGTSRIGNHDFGIERAVIARLGCEVRHNGETACL
jgi:hypothetical protein